MSSLHNNSPTHARSLWRQITAAIVTVQLLTFLVLGLVFSWQYHNQSTSQNGAQPGVNPGAAMTAWYFGCAGAAVIITSWLLVRVIRSRFERLIGQLADGVARIGGGHLDARIPAGSQPSELAPLAAGINQMAQHLQEQIDRWRETEARLQLAIEAIQMGVFEVDLTNGEITWSETVGPLHGLPEGSPSPDWQTVLNWLHPDDRKMVVDEFEAAKQSRRPFEVAYRVYPPAQAPTEGVSNLDSSAHLDGDSDANNANADPEDFSAPFSAPNWLAVLGNIEFDANDEPKRLTAVIWDITETKRTQQQLQMLNDGVEHSLNGFDIVDDKGRFVYVNPAYKKMWGYNETDDLIGQFPAGHCVDPEMPKRIIATLHEHGHEVFEFEARRKDDSTFTVLMAARMFTTATGHVFYTGASIDITEQRRAQRALHESEKRYRQLVESSPYCIHELDREGRITSMNRAGLCMLGLANVRDIAGTPYLDAVAEPDRQRVGRLMEAAFVGTPSEFEFHTPTGASFASSFVPLANAENQITRLMGITMDITDKKRTAEQLERLLHDLEERVQLRTAELEAAKDRAESADRLKSAFLANMSHELRTPLNSILGFTGILLRELAGPLTEEQRRQLGMVSDSAHHLLLLINDVLDLSKIESGQLEIRPQAFDLSESIERCANSVSPDLKRKRLSLEIDIEPGLNCMVTDQRRFEQILLNLLSNAVKYTQKGTVRVEARRSEIPPTNGDDEPVPAIDISVIDTGIGIPKDFIPDLFKPFSQVDMSHARTTEGTGLGLAICGRLTRAQGGSIQVETEPGKGSRFRLKLPLRVQPRGPNRIATPPPQPQAQPHSEHPT